MRAVTYRAVMLEHRPRIHNHPIPDHGPGMNDGPIQDGDGGAKMGGVVDDRRDRPHRLGVRPVLLVAPEEGQAGLELWYGDAPHPHHDAREVRQFFPRRVVIVQDPDGR